MKSWLTPLCLITAMVYTLLFTNSCRHCDDPTNPDCGNYNPCYGVDGKADFDCSEYFDENTDLLVKCDTLIASSHLSWFGSTHEYLSYQWKVGSDTNTRNGKSFLIQFTKPFGTIPVTLIGTRKPRPECLPGDDGVDTFTKAITIVDEKASPLFGKFKGALTHNPTDTFTIAITANHGISQIGPFPAIFNLIRNCDVILPIINIGYKQFAEFNKQYSPSGSCYYSTEIRGKLDSGNQFITITYTAYKSKEHLTETFIGSRIP